MDEPRWERIKQGVRVGDASSGIQVTYTKSRRMVHLSGWFDHICAIEGGNIPLSDFLAAPEVKPNG